MAKKTASRKATGTAGAGGRATGTAKVAAKRKSTVKRTKAAKRELVDTTVDKRFVRRNRQGEFKESDDVGRSLSRDSRTRAKKTVKSGQGDKGDRRR
jgi:hypothetical protein